MNCVTVNHITPIIKVADFCNFTCGFCRYSNNPHKSLMPFSTFKTIIEKACEYNLSNNYYELDVVFHGGVNHCYGDMKILDLQLNYRMSWQKSIQNYYLGIAYRLMAHY